MASFLKIDKHRRDIDQFRLDWISCEFPCAAAKIRCSALCKLLTDSLHIHVSKSSLETRTERSWLRRRKQTAYFID